MRTVFIVLPAFNEASNLRSLLPRITSAMSETGLHYEVIIVDDGSEDHTYTVATTWHGALPVHVYRHVRNEGLGPTLRDGLMYAIARASSSDVIVTMDADGTHDPGLIGAMVRAIQAGSDVVIASRYRVGANTSGVPMLRTALSSCAAYVFRCTFPIVGVLDYTSGFRAYRAGALIDASSQYPGKLIEQSGFQCMAELLLKLRRLPTLRFSELPITLQYERKQGASKMRVFRTVRQTMTMIIRMRLSICFQTASIIPHTQRHTTRLPHRSS